MVRIILRSRKEKWSLRVQSQLTGRSDRPRLSVYRSSKSIFAQVIDDSSGRTLLSVSTRGTGGTKSQAAFKAGHQLAQELLKRKIDRVVFDRGGYKFHGRVKALAAGAREGGLKF